MTSPPFTLRSPDLEVVVDPGRGAEIVTVRERATGLQILGRTPWRAAEPAQPPAEEEAWKQAYRGGWQLLTPNAGEACTVGGRRHGFHGDASQARWDLMHAAEDEAALTWRDDGLTITRILRLRRDELAVTTRWEARDRSVPVLHVEHLAVGPALLDPAVELRLPGGTVERLGFEHPRTGFSVVRDFPDGTAELRNTASGLTLRASWDVAQLPFLWLWHELRVSDGPWDRATEILGLEPSSSASHGGLAEAIANGDATWVAPGAPVEHTMRLRIGLTP